MSFSSNRFGALLAGGDDDVEVDKLGNLKPKSSDNDERPAARPRRTHQPASKYMKLKGMNA